MNSKTKSPERLAVEKALKTAPPTGITQWEISEKTGLCGSTVRIHLHNCITHGCAQNMNPGILPARYRAGALEQPVKPRINEPRTCLTLGPLKPVRMIATREGADNHKNAPTVRNGIAHPYAPPFAMASSAESLPKST